MTEKEALRINNIVADLRIAAAQLGKHNVLFPSADCDNCEKITATCEETCPEFILGAGIAGPGHTLDVSELLRYIADMMEV